MKYDPNLGMAVREPTERRLDRWVAQRAEEIVDLYRSGKCLKADAMYGLSQIGVDMTRAAELLEGRSPRK